MRIFLAGATGFLGSALVPVLRRAGHDVIALSRNAESARKKLRYAKEIVEGDLLQPAQWTKAVDGCDAVINLSGEQAIGRRWTPELKQKIYATRIEATVNLVRAIEEASQRPHLLINASAAGYYSPSDQRALTEESPPGTDALAQLCVAWEAAAQQAAAQRAEALGPRVIMLRLGVVLHHSGGALKKLLPLYKFGLGGPIGSGKQGFPWIHRDDLTAAIRFIIENDSLSGPINVVAPETISNRQFAKTLGRLMKRPALIPTPAWALRLLFKEGAEGLIHGCRPVPVKLQQAGFTFTHPTLRNALNAILQDRL